MPTYKLHYFDGRGRAELSRLIFAAAGQQYEDIRYPDESWALQKAGFHFGVLPVLEVDGERIGQSAAIAHYLASQFGLAGKTPIESFKCHSLAEYARDMIAAFYNFVFYEKDEKRIAELKEKFEKVTLPDILSKLESYAAKNAGASGFLVGDALSYADLAIYATVEAVDLSLKRDILANFPLLTKNKEAVAKNPRIAEWLEKRPKTDR